MKQSLKRIGTEVLVATSIFGGAFGITAAFEGVTNYVNHVATEQQIQKVSVEPVASVEIYPVTAYSLIHGNEIKPRLHNVGKKYEISEKEFDCIARNIYYEAGVEDRVGKIAVAQVTYNRLKEKHWGDSYCKVIYAKNQFSWTRDKSKRHAKPDGPLWNQSVQATKDFLHGVRVIGLGNAQYYHADYISQPHWAKKFSMVDKIGTHIFYVATN